MMIGIILVIIFIMISMRVIMVSYYFLLLIYISEGTIDSIGDAENASS